MMVRVEAKPMRRVTKDRLRGGGSIFAPFKYHWWELELECGHTVERRCRYAKMEGAPRGYAAQHRGASLTRLLDAPKRVLCHVCVGQWPSRHA